MILREILARVPPLLSRFASSFSPESFKWRYNKATVFHGITVYTPGSREQCGERRNTIIEGLGTPREALYTSYTLLPTLVPFISRADLITHANTTPLFFFTQLVLLQSSCSSATTQRSAANVTCSSLFPIFFSFEGRQGALAIPFTVIPDWETSPRRPCTRSERQQERQRSPHTHFLSLPPSPLLHGEPGVGSRGLSEATNVTQSGAPNVCPFPTAA